MPGEPGVHRVTTVAGTVHVADTTGTDPDLLSI